jgi:negative regulator of flagellin synthesis FlgM
MASIDSITSNTVSRAYVQSTDATQSTSATQQANAHPRHHGHAQQPDSVSLSEGARSRAAARKAVDSTADVREEKVAAIKQQISDGTYSVSSRVLAQKMLSNAQQSQQA